MKNKINLSDHSLLDLVSILRHDLDEWSKFYTDTCPFDCEVDDICQVSTDELKKHISWKILNGINNSNFLNNQKIAKDWQVKRLRKDIEKALNPWNI